jgi:CheY-like chemotaxis protein
MGDPVLPPIKVLVVEPDPMNMEALANLVTSEGFEALPAFDERDALKHLEEDEPHVVLVDLEGPRLVPIFEMLADKARGPGAAIPVILIDEAPAMADENEDVSQRDITLAELRAQAGVVERLHRPVGTKEIAQAIVRHAPSFDNS